METSVIPFGDQPVLGTPVLLLASDGKTVVRMYWSSWVLDENGREVWTASTIPPEEAPCTHCGATLEQGLTVGCPVCEGVLPS